MCGIKLEEGNTNVREEALCTARESPERIVNQCPVVDVRCACHGQHQVRAVEAVNEVRSDARRLLTCIYVSGRGVQEKAETTKFQRQEDPRVTMRRLPVLLVWLQWPAADPTAQAGHLGCTKRP